MAELSDKPVINKKEKETRWNELITQADNYLYLLFALLLLGLLFFLNVPKEQIGTMGATLFGVLVVKVRTN